MAIAEDLPLLAGMLIILAAIVFISSTPGLPGLGEFDNPIHEIRSDIGEDEDTLYDVSTQAVVTSTALGDTEIGQFTYQTQQSGLFLSSIGSLSFGDLAFTGADNVKADVRVVNQDTGKVYVQTTKFVGELEGGGSAEVDVKWDNAPSGSYLVRYIVTYDPSVSDPTDLDNVKRLRKTIEVPKGGVQQ